MLESNNVHTTACLIIGTQSDINRIAHNYGQLKKYSGFHDAAEYVISVSSSDLFNPKQLRTIIQSFHKTAIVKYDYLLSYLTTSHYCIDIRSALIKANLYLLLQIVYKEHESQPILTVSVTCNGKIDECDKCSIVALVREFYEEMSLHLTFRFLMKNYQMQLREHYRITDVPLFTLYKRNYLKQSVLYLILVDDSIQPQNKAPDGIAFLHNLIDNEICQKRSVIGRRRTMVANNDWLIS